jgi:outer membrane receptor protein involved in Fe transport
MSMNSNTKLRLTIAAILRGSALGTLGVSTLGVGLAHAADSDADVADSGAIPEIVVTAERRSESLENVPITIQAITGDELQKLNVQTFEDVLRYTPNVTFAGNGPGQGNIFMRGLSAGGAPNQSQSTTSPFPNVGLYLDDQSMQFPGRNNDPYLVDIERVEVLEGPQGTLFGGGAEAGAIRYLTNKPKIDVTEGNANAGYGYTSGGDPNFMANATINLPLIPDTLAVRATVFTDRRGGYISNVPGTIAAVANPATGVNATPTANNAPLVGSNLNPVDYDGLRFSALWKINEDWNFLVQQNYQSMEADGYFSSYPKDPNGVALQPYQITAFAPAYNKDKYESTSWTLSGKLPESLSLVYTGSYLDRHVQQQADYSNYLRSAVGSNYDCTGAGARYSYYRDAKPTTCYAPVGNWNDTTRNTHLSQELRVSTPDDWRIRGLVGAFYEDFKIYDEMNFNYLPIPQCNTQNLAIANGGGPDCLSAVGPIPGYFANDPGPRVGSNTAFGEDVMRGYRQTAFFASGDVDIIPKVLTFTAGTRWFHYSEFEEGSEFYSESSSPLILSHANGACTAVSACGFGINLKKTETGTRSRLNLTWHITPDIMTYYTYSQGFRPGGFNRTKTALDGVVSLHKEAPYTAGDGASSQYNKPAGYDSDNLINNEVGLKAELLDHRLQINASAYYMYWSNTQFVFFDPVHLGNTTFVVNGPSYEIKGLELQFVARVTEGLTVQGSSSWNSSNQYTSPCLPSNRPTATNPTPLGTCITQINSAPYTNPFGAIGTRAAYSPPFEYNVRGRYDFRFNEYKPFVSVGASFIGEMYNQPANYPSGALASENPPTTTLVKYLIPGYYTYDAAIGVTKDNWTVQITGSNLSNSDAAQVISSGQYIESEVPLRPRVVTLQVGMKF